MSRVKVRSVVRGSHGTYHKQGGVCWVSQKKPLRFHHCGAWCLFDFDSPEAVSYGWDNGKKCWSRGGGSRVPESRKRRKDLSQKETRKLRGDLDEPATLDQDKHRLVFRAFATRNSQLATRISHLATHNWQLATRNSQLATHNLQLACLAACVLLIITRF